MRADEQTSSWSRDGHMVFIGPVQTAPELRYGKRWHYRAIFLDGRLIEKSQGKNLARARYNAGFAVERELKTSSQKHEPQE